MGADWTDRLWLRVDRNGPPHPYDPTQGRCWIWTGSTSRGYGQLRVNGKSRSVHRLAFRLATGNDPVHDVLHSCDRRACCNPHHLRAGTAKDNVADMYDRGRAVVGSSHKRAKLTEAEVVEMRASYAAGLTSQRTLAKVYLVSQRVVGLVVRKESWRHT